MHINKFMTSDNLYICNVTVGFPTSCSRISCLVWSNMFVIIWFFLLAVVTFFFTESTSWWDKFENYCFDYFRSMFEFIRIINRKTELLFEVIRITIRCIYKHWRWSILQFQGISFVCSLLVSLSCWLLKHPLVLGWCYD